MIFFFKNPNSFTSYVDFVPFLFMRKIKCYYLCAQLNSDVFSSFSEKHTKTFKVIQKDEQVYEKHFYFLLKRFFVSSRVCDSKVLTSCMVQRVDN